MEKNSFGRSEERLLSNPAGFFDLRSDRNLRYTYNMIEDALLTSGHKKVKYDKDATAYIKEYAPSRQEPVLLHRWRNHSESGKLDESGRLEGFRVVLRGRSETRQQIEQLLFTLFGKLEPQETLHSADQVTTIYDFGIQKNTSDPVLVQEEQLLH